MFPYNSFVESDQNVSPMREVGGANNPFDKRWEVLHDGWSGNVLE
jgi:hypothetical protein